MLILVRDDYIYLGILDGVCHYTWEFVTIFLWVLV